MSQEFIGREEFKGVIRDLKKLIDSKTFISVAGDVSGSGANQRVGYWTAPKVLSGTDNFKWTGTSLDLLDIKTKGPIADVRAYGAVGNGVADDTAAILAALAASSVTYMPAGTYKITSGLTINAEKHLIGAGFGNTIIRPSAAVGIAATINSGSLEKVGFDGTDTNGKIGVLCGSVLSNAVELRDVVINNFLGAGGIGLKVRQIVSSSFTRVFIDNNQKNIYITGEASDGTPTTIWFRDGITSGAIEEGTLIDGGYQVIFSKFIFQSNYQEGLKIEPVASGNATFGILRDCWFENNWRDDPNRTTKYSLVMDGTASGSSAGIHLDNIFFSGSGSTEKSIDLNMVRWTSFSRVTTPNVAGSIRVQDSDSEVTFVDDSGRTALALLSNPDGAYVWYPMQGTINAAGVQMFNTIRKLTANPAVADLSENELCLGLVSGTAKIFWKTGATIYVWNHDATIT
jgi:hypothetical protein